MSWKRPLPPLPGHAAAGYGCAEPPAKAARSLYGYSSDAGGESDGLSSALASSRLYCGFSGSVGEMGPPGSVGEHGVVQGVRAGFSHGAAVVAGAAPTGAGLPPPPPPGLARAAAVAAPGPLLGPAGSWSAHIANSVPEDMDEPVGDGVFAAEVERIACIEDAKDYRRVLGLDPKEALDAKVIQTRYKHIMRIIHPDKRRPREVAQAGGKQICDDAVLVVFQALAAGLSAARQRGPTAASAPAPEDPEAVRRRQAQQLIQRQQEVVRAQAQAARMRGAAIEQAEQQKCRAKVGQLIQSIQKTLLIESLEHRLVTDGQAAQIVSAPVDGTTAQILALLGQRSGANGSTRLEPAADVVDLT